MNTVTTFLRLVFVTLGLSGLAGPVSAQTAAIDCQKLTGDAAIAACDRAIRQDPKNSVHFYNRGLVWSAKGDKDRALSDYNQAIRLNPQFADAFNNRGNFYNRGLAWSAKGDKDRAISDYNQAIQLNPQFADAFNNRGNAWSAKGDKDKAISDYNEAIRLNPQHALAFSNRGLAWSAKGFKDKARSDYNEAIRLLRCSATIWMRKQRQSGMLSWRSQFDDDCRDATITLAIFVGRRS